jgi:metal-dependent amidase/aminoacylase/carboxypeptidase family protein
MPADPRPKRRGTDKRKAVPPCFGSVRYEKNDEFQASFPWGGTGEPNLSARLRKDCWDYDYYPGPVINDDDLNRIAHDAVIKLYGEESLREIPMMMGSEDVVHYADKIPTVFGFLGSRNEALGPKNGCGFRHRAFLPGRKAGDTSRTSVLRKNAASCPRRKRNPQRRC